MPAVVAARRPRRSGHRRRSHHPPRTPDSRSWGWGTPVGPSGPWRCPGARPRPRSGSRTCSVTPSLRITTSPKHSKPQSTPDFGSHTYVPQMVRSVAAREAPAAGTAAVQHGAGRQLRPQSLRACMHGPTPPHTHRPHTRLSPPPPASAVCGKQTSAAKALTAQNGLV
eukprot:COSAG01_NODE_1459_length_10250_cov_5.016846_3_plen_168_part_00